MMIVVALSQLLATLQTPPRCVVDNASARQLPHQVCEISGGCATLSVEWCAAQCRARGFKLAGVEAGPFERSSAPC